MCTFCPVLSSGKSVLSKTSCMFWTLIHLSAQDEVKGAQGELNKHKDLLKARNKDINAAATQQRALQKESSAAQLKVQELQHKVTKGQKDSQDAARQVGKCGQGCEWSRVRCWVGMGVNCSDATMPVPAFFKEQLFFVLFFHQVL